MGWPNLERSDLPLAHTDSPSIIASRRAVSLRLQRYRAIRDSLTAIQRRECDRLLARQFAREFPPELMAWGRYFLPHYFTLPPSGLHHYLAEILQWKHKEQQTHDAVIAPRSGAKTTWTSKLYTLFCICHDLTHYVLLIGDSSEQSWQNLAAIKKELTENSRLQSRYPHACGQGRRWNESYIITRNDIKIEALGTRKKVRGRTHGAHRPGLIIIDDLENDEGVQSAMQRDKVYRWLNRALLPSGSESCNVLFVGTALHPDDALNRLRQNPGWRLRSFAALPREPARQDLWDAWRAIYRNLGQPAHRRRQAARKFYDEHHTEMHAGAEVLWPEKEPLYDLMLWREDKGEVAFQAEKQGNAAATGQTEFGAELFPSDIWFETWPDLTLRAMSLDPSKGQNERNDFSAFVWGGLADDGRVYIDADIARRDVSQVVADGLQIYRRFLPHRFGIETVMFLELFANIFEMEAQRLGLLLPITQVRPHQSKLVRIRQLTPYLKSGRLRFRAGSRGAEMLVEQLKWFPTGRHDDGPDALQMLMDLLRQMDTTSITTDQVITT